MSPTSVKLALRLIRAGASDTVEGCLRREYRVVCALKEEHDFYEGVRAQLIDKDRAPRWSPATLAGVTDAHLDRYFGVPASGELDFT